MVDCPHCGTPVDGLTCIACGGIAPKSAQRRARPPIPSYVLEQFREIKAKGRNAVPEREPGSDDE
jgi:hypothetical protein